MNIQLVEIQNAEMGKKEGGFLRLRGSRQAGYQGGRM